MSAPFDPELYETELRHGHLRLRDGQDGRVIEVEGLTISSRFEPVFSRAHGRPVGHRGVAEIHLAGQCLSQDRASAEIEARACAQRVEALSAGLHMSNYADAMDRGWLLLEVPSAVVAHTQLWPPLPQDLFSSSTYAPHHLVLEIDAGAAAAQQMADFVEYHRSLGFSVALSGFGRTQTDLGRVIRTRPDIVGLARRTLPADVSMRSTRLLSALTRLLHECGVMVSVGGVDDADTLEEVLATDTDLLEGDAAALLTQMPPKRHPPPPFAEHRSAITEASSAIARGEVFESACEPLLGMSGVLRCFLLDTQGTQLTGNLSPIGIGSAARFWPLANAAGANWSHRSYFRTALGHPGQVMMTDPYFSPPDGHHCVTLSIAFSAGEDELVLCCDLAEST